MSDHDNRAPRVSAQVAPEAARRPDRTLAAIVVLAVIALAGTITLLPSTEEKAAGLIADERYDDAIELLGNIADLHQGRWGWRLHSRVFTRDQRRDLARSSFGLCRMPLRMLRRISSGG